MDNLHIYEQARSVPDSAKKTISAGRLKGMTDVSPMWRIKKLTEMFGPCGMGWWYTITDKRIVSDDVTKTSAAFVDILLYYADPESGAVSQGIPGTGGSMFVTQESKGARLSDECFKMALTDAISVAAKALGVAADVYYAKDISKYSEVEDKTDTTKNEPHKKLATSDPAKKTDEYFCECCGREITPYTGVKGEPVSVDKHVKASKSRFEGAVFCVDCITSGAIYQPNENAG